MKKFHIYPIHIILVASFILIVWVLCMFYINNHYRGNILKVAFLDIGQGDSIYIESPNGRQMLIDGGPDNRVMQALGKVMPFGDRSIDLVLATHADADHIGGLPQVIEDYKVSQFIFNGVKSDTDKFGELQDKIQEKNIKEIIAEKPMHIILDQDKNIYFDIIFPDRDISKFTETNDGSIVGRLVYGNESFMLTGDATRYTEHLIMETEDSATLHSQVLKLGHHGSRTSSSELWLEKVNPEIAIISAGKKNRYGHPHKEVLDLLQKLKIPYIATYDKGTIILKTDGTKIFK